VPEDQNLRKVTFPTMVSNENVLLWRMKKLRISGGLGCGKWGCRVSSMGKIESTSCR
jgi:hypothetical protein